MLKNVLILGILTLFISTIDPPDKTGEKIFKLMKSEKIEKIEKYYLNKAEFVDFVNAMERQPPKEQMDEMVQNYDRAREAHLMAFKNINVEHKGDLKISRVEYDYQIGKPGKDEKIRWPESKSYEPVNTPSEQVKVNLTYFLEANDKEYVMKLEMMNFKGEWKLFHMLRPCTVYENL